MRLAKPYIGLSGPNSILCKNFIKHYSKMYNFCIYRDDINNINNFDKWLSSNKNLEAFINFAAMVSTSKCENNKKLATQTNFKSVIKILNLFTKKKSIKFKYFLALSSSHVFSPSKNKIKENFKKKPINYYGKTKLKMEKRLLKKKEIFDIGIGRIFNYYNKTNKNGYFVNDVLSNLKSKKNLIKFYGVDTYRDFIELRDILSAINHMIKNKLSGDYNICSGKKFYLKTLINTINKKVNKKITFFDTQKKDYIGDNSKLIKTGWTTKFPIRYKNFA